MTFLIYVETSFYFYLEYLYFLFFIFLKKFRQVETSFQYKYVNRCLNMFKGTFFVIEM